MTKNNLKVLYLGGFRLPDKNAASHRVIETRKMIESFGGKLYAIGVNKVTDDLHQISDYDFEIPYPNSIYKWIIYLNSIKYFIKFLKNHNDIGTILLYNFQSIASIRMIKFCRKNNIRIISDCTEWYSGNTGKLLFRIIKKLDTYIRMRIVNFHYDKLIVSSTYLKSYYIKKDVLIVPMLFNKANQLNSYMPGNKIKLIYTGIPFDTEKKLNNRTDAKDRLDIVISYLNSAHKQGIDFYFQIFGITKKQYINVLPDDANLIEEMGTKIDFFGFVNNHLVREKIVESDFTILIRDSNRVTLSGFPTKFSESISLGVPIITNNVGDISLYLQEGINGYMLDISEFEKSKNKFFEILKKSPEERKKIREKCIQYEQLTTDRWTKNVVDFLVN